MKAVTGMEPSCSYQSLLYLAMLLSFSCEVRTSTAFVAVESAVAGRTWRCIRPAPLTATRLAMTSSRRSLPQQQPPPPQQRQEGRRRRRRHPQGEYVRPSLSIDAGEALVDAEIIHEDSFTSMVEDGVGRDGDRVKPLVILATVAALTVLLVWCEHAPAGLDWLGELPWGASASPTGDPAAAKDAYVHFSPLRSVATGAGAGISRAFSRIFTFPLDTIKSRQQVSRLRAEDRAAMPEEMCRMIDQPASFEGVFRGFSAFLAQAAPSNAIFFLCYDALNAMGTTALLASGAAGVAGSSLPSTALHLGASSIATVPSNLVRTPAEVVKQRLQVGQERGSSLAAVKSIVKSEGIRGLFVGGKEQLLREIPFNALQFAMYECLKSYAVLPELWTDAALGAVSSSVAALATQPIDTVKTRVMTKSVPGTSYGAPQGFIKSAAFVVEAEGLDALYLGVLPRILLVSTGGAFYFWGQEFASQLLSHAGI